MGKRGPAPQRAPQAAQAGPAPRMPAGMSKRAAAVWRRVVPQLAARGLVEALDALALSDMCEVVAQLAECRDARREQGLLVQGDRGKVKNPILQIERELRNALQRWCSEFGLTPGSRARQNAPEADPKPQSLEDFLFEEMLDANLPGVRPGTNGHK